MATIDTECGAAWRTRPAYKKDDWRCYKDFTPQESSWNDRHFGMQSKGESEKWRTSRQSLEHAATTKDDLTEFRRHVSKWKRDTLHLSSVGRMTTHGSYLRIIALASASPELLSVLLYELETNPDHWFIALNAITGEDPVPAGSTFAEAVSSWTAWGRQKGLLR
jgi:hypothetical protein